MFSETQAAACFRATFAGSSQQGREGGDGGGSGRRARLRHDVTCYPPSSSPGPQQGCRGGHHPSLGIDGDPGCARPRPAIRIASHRGSLQVPMRALRSPATPVRARRACPCAAQSQKREINYGSCSARAVAVLPVSTVATCEAAIHADAWFEFRDAFLQAEGVHDEQVAQVRSGHEYRCHARTYGPVHTRRL